ncbi:MAG: hypothetical protein H0X65_17590 [Gemmatimonadetes bacterium]|nr:hypothetical protein [Gemmatimonadota bacterium]
MIPILLRDLGPRMLLVMFAGLILYALEPAFHQHGAAPAEMAAELGPLGISATLANLTRLSMLILLAGFIANDRRRGYYRIFFSHPTNPLAFYALRWVIALGVALLATALFLVVGQLAAWGEVRGGGAGLLLALLTAVAYGGLIAFLSAALPRGDAWVTVLIFLFTFAWLQVLALGAEPLTAPIRQVITFLLPPETALRVIYASLMLGHIEWGAAMFVAGYGFFWLVAAGLLLRIREWP